MGRYLLDTDAIIDHIAGMVSSIALIESLFDRGETLCVSDVVVAEVYSGLRPEDRGKGESLLSACFYLPTPLEAARKAGEWRYTYARRGIALSTTDLLIAGTALLHEATLVTRNADHYPMSEISILSLPRMR